MRGRVLLTFIAAAGVTSACESTTEAKITYKATLAGTQEVPPVTSSGTGTWTATLDASTNTLTYELIYQGLGSAATMAHIHGPAAAGVNANVLVDFATGGRTLTLGTTGSGGGTISLAATSVITSTVSGDSLRKLMDSGNAYVNIHSVTNGGGEIRGQIVRQ